MRLARKRSNPVDLPSIGGTSHRSCWRTAEPKGSRFGEPGTTFSRSISHGNRRTKQGLPFCSGFQTVCDKVNIPRNAPLLLPYSDASTIRCSIPHISHIAYCCPDSNPCGKPHGTSYSLPLVTRTKLNSHSRVASDAKPEWLTFRVEALDEVKKQTEGLSLRV